ncbi:helix-turn-helix domain-containing protein [Nonomuraea purpurea]|uniref:Helix-turn-helix domain-containing protein n=1 Tax=Nonomuraea purpurea TaxID=1849276 RepID=A0ABV8GA68_9ACTN
MNGRVATEKAGIPLWAVFGKLLRLWRDKSGMGLRAVADGIHVDYSALARWERGEHRPNSDAIPALDALLEAGGQLVAFHAAIAELDRLHGSRLVPSESAASAQDEDGDMERRAAIQLLSALSAGAAIPAGTLETVLSGVERALGVRDDLRLDDWEQTVRTYGQLYYAKPPQALVSDLTADLIEVSRALTRENALSVRTGLTRVSAQLSALIATDFSDAGNQRAARLAWQTARRTADASGDRDLSVWVRARHADSAFWQGHPHSVVTDLLDDATHRSQGMPSVGLALAWEVRAKLLATQRATADANAALNGLSETFNRLPHHVTTERAIGSSIGTSYPEAAVHRTRAYVYAFLADTRNAPSAVEQALSTYPQGLAGGNLRLIQALTLIHGGRLDEGLQQALPIAGSVPRLTPMRHLIIGQILDAVPTQSRNLPAAQDLRAMVARTV